MIIFDESVATNQQNLQNMQRQYRMLNRMRRGFAANDARMFSESSLFQIPPEYNWQGIRVNAGINPQELFREFDRVTVEQFRLDEGDNILTPLMTLARSLPIGRTVYAFTRASDSGQFQSSMSGEVGTIFDNVDYDSDKTIIPVHTTGFKRNFREYEQLSLEDFDDLINLQREDIRRHRNGLIDTFLDGHLDLDGNTIQHDSTTWTGVRNDTRVDQVTGIVDLTSAVTTAEAIRNQFLALTQRRYITNKVTVPAIFWVSDEIWFNLQRYYTDDFISKGTILENLKTLTGVQDIRNSSKLTGNQVLSFPLQQRFIQPLVGRGVGTIQRARFNFNDPYEWETVSAIGWMAKTDFGGTNRAIQYATT